MVARINKLSKFLKILRVSYNESAREMAEKLEISPSYLSSIESGKRPVPENFEEKMIDCYDLAGEELKEFREAVHEMQGYLTFNPSNLKEDERMLIMKLLNKSIDESTIQKLCGIVKGDDDK